MKKLDAFAECVGTYCRTEGVIGRCLVFPTLLDLAFKYTPANEHWIIRTTVIFYLSIFVWKYVRLRRGKEWK
jgi:hypothetical protein